MAAAAISERCACRYRYTGLPARHSCTGSAASHRARATPLCAPGCRPSRCCGRDGVPAVVSSAPARGHARLPAVRPARLSRGRAVGPASASEAGCHGARPRSRRRSAPVMRWSMDFVSDALADGRKIRALTIVDAHTRECPAIELIIQCPAPTSSVSSTGCVSPVVCPQPSCAITGRSSRDEAFDQWATLRQVTLQFIESDKPVQNAFSESFNGRVRDECLNESWCVSLQDARETIGAWRVDYNDVCVVALRYFTFHEPTHWPDIILGSRSEVTSA
jgi:transposase InsO family protein